MGHHNQNFLSGIEYNKNIKVICSNSYQKNYAHKNILMKEADTLYILNEISPIFLQCLIWNFYFVQIL